MQQLTLKEYTNVYSKVLSTFSKSQRTSWEESVYKVNKGYKPEAGKLLFLYSYALSTWEYDDTAINYITELQVLSIINRVNHISWN